MSTKIKKPLQSDHKTQFESIKVLYDSLGSNISQALTILLNDLNIPHLSVYYRVKETDSFLQKIQRKAYDNPIIDVEDLCGIRIICYYQSDISKIYEKLKSEFDVIESQDKEQLLETNEFGYRSYHLIVKIKKEWLSTPNYRKLKDLKAEIQIRTVLMHAWAEIEHKLSYKSEADIPKQFQRQLSRISAKLEEADEQFEKLKNDVAMYRSDLIREVEKNNGLFEDTLELNLDNLQVFLDLNFPDRQKNLSETAKLLDDLREYNISLKMLNEYYRQLKQHLINIEKEVNLFAKSNFRWAQVGVVRTIMDICNNQFFAKREPGFPESILIPLKKYRKIIRSKKSK